MMVWVYNGMLSYRIGRRGRPIFKRAFSGFSIYDPFSQMLIFSLEIYNVLSVHILWRARTISEFKCTFQK